MQDEPKITESNAKFDSAAHKFRLIEQNGRVIIRAKLWALVFVLLLLYATLVFWFRDYLLHIA